MKVSTEIDNNFGYEKITQLVDNIPLRGSITIGGKAFLETEFEKLDSMLRTTIRFPSSMDNMYTWP
jgi:hypothetical protein